MYDLVSAPLTKETSTTVLPDQVDGDTGLAPWLRAMPSDPERRNELDRKIRKVHNIYM